MCRATLSLKISPGALTPWDARKILEALRLEIEGQWIFPSVRGDFVIANNY
jgi:hypothetical protein